MAKIIGVSLIEVLIALLLTSMLAIAIAKLTVLLKHELATLLLSEISWLEQWTGAI